MNPMVVLAGIGLAFKGIKWIFDELTDDEKAKQQKIDILYKRNCDDIKAYEESIRKQAEDVIAKNNADCEKELNRLKLKLEEFSNAKNSQLNDVLLKLIEERISEKNQLVEDIEKTVKNVYAVLKNETLTNLRRNTLERFCREIEEGKAKVKSYILYLVKYQRYIERNKYKNIKGFSFLLPVECLYRGKIIHLKKHQISAGIESINVENIFNDWYYIEDADSIEELDENISVPVLCSGYDYNKKANKLSIVKGKLKYFFLNCPQIGVTAQVKKYDRNVIVLSYDDVELRLPFNKLENPNRIPPLKAELRVYPYKWRFSLDGKIIVSEYVGDGYRHTTFSEIPIVFTNEQWENIFLRYLEENNLVEHEGDWKIAPYNEYDMTESSLVKLQLDAELVFAAEIKNDKQNRAYFSFVEILDKEHMLKPDDIFLGIDCTLATVLDEDLNIIRDEFFNNMTDLVYCAFYEFKIQKQAKLSMAGMQYFNKWAEVTDKLITYLTKKGGNFLVEIDPQSTQFFYDKKRIVLEVLNAEELNEFINLICSKESFLQREKWFFEIEKNMPCFVNFNADGTNIIITADDERFTTIKAFLEGKEEIVLYHKAFCYAEIQQAAALFSFRIGKIVNPKLQAYALDGKNVVSEEEELHDVKFINLDIENDASQKEAVIRALKQKNFFLIQGPPGTGKTTVIREIIAQTLLRNPKTKILVVSQANVAVDNVLKGLIKNNSNINFIRCGTTEKMDESITPYSIEYKYADYVSSIRTNYQKNPNNGLVRKWYRLVDNGASYNSNVSELLIREADIIGATCVGLAQKKIGLGQATFDLAIIDEAGKALPAEILIPFIRAKKVIMIGDHKQLPPTINSALCDASKVDFDDRSLFEESLFGDSLFSRIFNAAPDSNKCMLKTQYRMPEVIGSLISKSFYEGNLKNGMNTINKNVDMYDNLAGLDKNIIFIDTTTPENNNIAKSVTNEDEANWLLKIMRILVANRKDTCCKIAVITPYKGQVRLIKKMAALDNFDLKKYNIVVNTVDAFQGDEAEIVIFCTTRREKCTDFFTDYRRINVAISRTKNQLFILGSLKYFDKYKEYKSGESPLPSIANFIRTNPNVVEVLKYDKCASNN